MVNEITISGNKRTKEFIILRELDFKKNDTINLADSTSLIETNENKIFNTNLFITVKLAFVRKDKEKISVLIILKERWYIFPAPIFQLADRNFNEWANQSNYSFSRIDWGLSFEHANFRGRKENLKLVVQSGFTRKYELFHQLPYVNKNRTLGLEYGVSYSTNKNVSYLATDNTRTFKSSENTLRKRFKVSLSGSYRKQFFVAHRFGTGYNNNNIDEELLKKNSQYLGEGKLKQQFIHLFYELDINKTNINYYPTKGWSLLSTITQNGIGVFKDLNLTELSTAVSGYQELKPWLILASRISAKTSTGAIQPYLQQQGLGFEENFVRGFEPFVIDAQHFALNRSEVKFKIISYTTSMSKILPFEEFQTIPNTIYINLFNDIGYAKNNNGRIESPLANTWLQGFGVGVDLVSFYDMVLRFEYAIAPKGENGIYFHFGKSI